MTLEIPRRLRRVRRVIEATLEDLPAPLKEALERSGAVVVLMDEPPEDVGPDTFGTFSGATYYETESPFAMPSEPPAIELYLSAFADLAGDPRVLDDEVRLTVLHEIGHFLGFTEEQLEDV